MASRRRGGQRSQATPRDNKAAPVEGLCLYPHPHPYPHPNPPPTCFLLQAYASDTSEVNGGPGAAGWGVGDGGWDETIMSLSHKQPTGQLITDPLLLMIRMIRTAVP